MKRRRILLLALVAVTVALVGAAWLLWPRTRITLENAERIQPDMTLEEVEAILGAPARDEAMGMSDLATLALMAECALLQHDKNEPKALVWRSDRAMIAVAFDLEGRVVDHISLASMDSLFERLRRWLHL